TTTSPQSPSFGPIQSRPTPLQTPTCQRLMIPATSWAVPACNGNRSSTPKAWAKRSPGLLLSDYGPGGSTAALPKPSRRPPSPPGLDVDKNEQFGHNAGLVQKQRCSQPVTDKDANRCANIQSDTWRTPSPERLRALEFQ